jgi:hypothetical protein
MKTTQKTLGTGITRRRLEISAPETLEDCAQLGYSGIHRFEDLLNGLASDCQNELRKHGLPCEPGSYFKQDGKWVKADDGSPRVGISLVRQTTAVLEDLKDEDYDSRVGYSARFLDLIASLRGRLKREETDPDALQKAYELGALLQEAKFKLKYETWTLGGANSARGLKRAGQVRANNLKAEKTPRNIAMAKEFLRRREKGSPLSDTALMTDIGKKWRPSLKGTGARAAIEEGLQKLKKSFGQGPTPST